MSYTKEQLLEFGADPGAPDYKSDAETVEQAEKRLKGLAAKARALGADGPVEQHSLAALKRALLEERDRMMVDERARAAAMEVKRD